MKKLDRGERRNRRIFFVILATYIITIVFLGVQIVRYRDGSVSPTGRTVAEYSFMQFECVLGLVLMALPSIVEKRIALRIPGNIYIIYVVFIYCAIYLGEVWSFFYRFSYWDVLLHSFSGIALGAMGFTVVEFLNKDERVRMSLSPFFVAFFAFCFAMAFGALWEICEFTIDGIFGVNMQKFALSDGTPFVGRQALSDTMEDLIVDGLGALASTALGYFTIIRERRKEKKNER